MMLQMKKHAMSTYIHIILRKASESKVIGDMSKFKRILKTAEDIVIVTGAGLSVESGIPTFHGKDNIWREFDAATLVHPRVFKKDPGLVWEFYHYVRELALKVEPNAAHKAITQYEIDHIIDKRVTVLTQNIDSLHTMAGTKNVIELHGSLFKTRCTKCNEVLVNTDSPICEVFNHRGSPKNKKYGIPLEHLPHCKKPNCGGLLRPHVVWFGEKLEPDVVEQLGTVLSRCTVLLVVGPSTLVFPAAAFPTLIAATGNVVAEFNTEPVPVTPHCHYFFTGPIETTLPLALNN